MPAKLPPPIPFPLRKECPPGACDCQRDTLLEQWHTQPESADIRIMRLTRLEEKQLLARIEALESYADLCRIEQRLLELLGVELTITPSLNGVRTVMGLQIRLTPRPGLCRRTREAVPAAVRRCLSRHPEIVYALLDAGDLLGGTTAPSPPAC